MRSRADASEFTARILERTRTNTVKTNTRVLRIAYLAKVQRVEGVKATYYTPASVIHTKLTAHIIQLT